MFTMSIVLTIVMHLLEKYKRYYIFFVSVAKD